MRRQIEEWKPIKAMENKYFSPYISYEKGNVK